VPTDQLRKLCADLAGAWRVRHVKQGLVGTCLIALGALSPAYLPRSTPLWLWLSPLQAHATAWRVSGTIITMLGTLLLVDAWFRLRPPGLADKPSHPGQTLSERLTEWWRAINLPSPPLIGDLGRMPARGWATLFCWVLPLLVAPPVFSQDAYSYAAQGWIVHNGLNPYAVGPGMLPGGFADQVASEWRMTPAPYGPLSLRISEALVNATNCSPYLAAWAERLPALLGVVMIGFFLPRIAHRMGADEHFAAWFALLNPMLVISFVGGAHNDALMMGFVVAGLWLAGLGRRHPADATRAVVPWAWLGGALLIGVGAAVKQPALLAAYALPFMSHPWKSWGLRDVVVSVARSFTSLALAVGMFCLVTLASGLGFGWVNAVNVPGRSVTVAPFTLAGLGIWHVTDWFGLGLDQSHLIAQARAVGVVVGIVILLFLALTLARRQPLAFMAWGYVTAALTGPALRTWYVQWSLTLLPLTRMNATMVRLSVWATLVMLGFDAMYMSMRNSAVAVCVGALLAMAWVAWGHLPMIHRPKGMT